jgi:hypothetical protein
MAEPVHNPIPVKSRALRSIGPYINGNLTVTWHSGRRSTWTQVPETIWAQLQAAESKGQFVNSHLKGKFKEV